MFKDSQDQRGILSKGKERSKRLYFYVSSGIFFCLVLAVIGFCYFVLNSDVLKVKQLSLNDTKLVSKDRVLAAIISNKINSDWRAWVGPENILFWLGDNQSILADRMLPALANISLTVDLWQRKVSVKAKERSFDGVWCDFNERCFAFDDEGVVFSLAPQASGNLILKIKDENNKQMNLGQNILPHEFWFKNMMITLAILKDANFLPADISINDYALKEWVVRSYIGPTFYFSFNFVPDDLAVVLKNLASRLNFSKITYFDFRVLNRVFYK
ncbi:MAG: hypothetical protein QMD65_00585 [Patescibacteria group bacterium]|nr:hypothetical protein [Patescibacteria group bacterium]